MMTGSTREREISTFKGQDRALRAGRIGMAGLLLSVLAASAPMMVVAGVMPTTYAVMGIVGQPLLFVILGVVLMLFSFGYAEMSRHVQNAGAFYAYIARGLGGTAGAAASVVALVAYSTLQVGIFGIFGFEVAGLIDQHLDVRIDWWIPAVAAVLLVGALGWLKIDLNVKVLGVLLLIEVALVSVFAVAGIGDPGGEGVSFHAFNPDTLTGAGLGTALCFCIASFTGFEQSPVYAEETSRPQVIVARVMFLAVGFTALFFALSSWVLGIAAGPSQVVAVAQQQGPGMLFGLTEDRLGGTFTNAMHAFYVTGMFAALLSFHNVVARYAFAMGREGLLPSAFGRTSKTSGAPAHGSVLQTVVSLVVVAGFALSDDKPFGDPTAPVLHLFTWAGNVGALGVMALMATASIAVIAFFIRRGSARAQMFRIICSGLAAIALTVIMVYAIRDFDVLLNADPDSALRWALPGVMGAAVVIGLGYGLVLRVARPDVHRGIGKGNEAFQLEKAATARGEASPPRTTT
ncbi:APC family permease [Streptomyces zagrosensis]|uniref:Amino acid transporter n=1 Tax=Streptomyces zagrosensis TaxID=1042984 RepID=A0A7W9UZ35_9ACTN|nr:APC family permease [Streptomyces zagrosensis]MBB5936347.1 amino acid transporter [Streptomyces zagrosensis]